MTLTRRTVLVSGAFSMLALPNAASAQSGGRSFGLYRGEDAVGEQRLSVTRQGSRLSVSVRVRISVRLLGLPVYDYALDARETWEGGQLVSLNAETDDNGTAQFARASRAEDGSLRISGSAHEGAVEDLAATTSYWTQAYLARPVWISTQDGRPLRITAQNTGTAAFATASGPIDAARWQIGGDLPGLVLYYDAAGEWVGSEFPVNGETIRIAQTERGAALAPLWTGA